MVSASVQDIVRRFKSYKSHFGGERRTTFELFHEKVVCLCVCMCVYVYVHMCVYVYTCVSCMYVCVCVCVCVYGLICTIFMNIQLDHALHPMHVIHEPTFLKIKLSDISPHSLPHTNHPNRWPYSSTTPTQPSPSQS